MKPVESIAPVLEEKTTEQEISHIIYDDWDHSPSSLELEEMEVGSSGGLRAALITALIFIVLVFCVILI